MASNEEMRRLVLLAADQLAQFPGLGRVIAAIGNEGNWATCQDMARDLRQQSATLALAEQTLRMVAACLADDEPEEAPP